MEQELSGLPELVKRALDHAARLQWQAEDLDELVDHTDVLCGVCGAILSLGWLAKLRLHEEHV